MGVFLAVIMTLVAVIVALLGARLKGLELHDGGDVDRVLGRPVGLLDRVVDRGLEVLLVNHEIGVLHVADLLGLELEVVRLDTG